MTWHYSGDVNIIEGGFYWRIPPSGFTDYVEAVEVFSFPEDEDNVFRINEGIIFMPAEKLVNALSCCGYSITPLGHIQTAISIETDTLPLLVDAYHTYWGIDDTSFLSTVTLGGPHQPRTSSGLRKYIIRECLS
jgi:hypothetical protein